MADEDAVSIRSEKKDKKQVSEDEDERLDFLLNYLTKSMRMKQEKWNKMIVIEDFKVHIMCAIIIFLFFKNNSY